MVTVYTQAGASLTIDDALAKEFNVKRGGEPISSDLLNRIKEEQESRKSRRAEIRIVNSRLEVPLPLADEVTERVLVNQASLP